MARITVSCLGQGNADPDDPHTWGCDRDGDATHWVNATRQRMKIRKMTDTHLLNAIAAVERWQNEPYSEEEIIAAMSFASTCRGEMASYYADQEVDRMLCGIRNAHPAYGGLLKEAHRRGLPVHIHVEEEG